MSKQYSLLKIDEDTNSELQGVRLYIAGDVSVLERKAIAVIGARDASADGCRRAAKLGRELARRGVTVVSGLAAGIDTCALTGAIEAGGRVAAVIGTPLDQAYPAANKRLQELIYREHLLISQFAPKSRVYPANFPARNRTMAAVSDASVIVEASNTSGSLHQAAECQRLGRWLGIARNMLDNPRVDWPQKFSGQEKTHILETTDGLLEAVYGGDA
ncbi:DNA-processing protein DprA [Paracoccus sp. SY]|uniref:DNA-processing protein DprA n=1 Tax=Paracoccus sp. SY TaxID=1330255 RepID=UPI001960DCC6|nr:DNA-processing protein DprA [Paracoccus sp. SY]